ncbi:histidinol dehydrogenase [bacterium F11]|nr:histidinol dehydrogenase [bacterium F11]
MKMRNLVSNIIQQVRRNGDKALLGFTKKFDKVSLTKKSLRIPVSRMRAALARLEKNERTAIEACARRVYEFHWEEKKRLPQSWTTQKNGIRFGQVYQPVDAVGIYVPGGRFSYPSTVLMSAIPAKLAGVNRRVVVTPPGRLTDSILAAAAISGVSELYQVGGPAAVAALAIGTKTIPKVDLIVGPGNALVTEAKRQLFGEVGIDLLAGPSELVVVADESAEPTWVASDMAAQAEHDPDAKSFLITTHGPLIRKVRQILPKKLLRQCYFFKESKIKNAIKRANDIAGEHVEIILKRPQECLDTLKNGGAFFINGWSPAVMGDYWAGPSHVLPTGRSAKFASGLSVLTFLKRSSLINLSSMAFKKGWKSARKMAEMEGLNLHADSLRIRINREI